MRPPLGASEVSELLRRHGVVPRKSLGQHFVIDPNTVKRTIRLANLPAGQKVVEVGAGCGSLTVALASAGCEVLAIETDERLLAPLKEVTAGMPVEIVWADAREIASWRPILKRLDGEPSGNWRMVANLPYNIGTQLILDVLDEFPEITEMLVMLQREAAERLAAAPGSASFGLPSLKVAYWSSAELLGNVPRGVFYPPPRVTSAFLRLQRRPAPPVRSSIEEIYSLAKPAFAGRRKMLRRSLRGVVPGSAFSAAGVPPESRPSELSLSDWSRLIESCRA